MPLEPVSKKLMEDLAASGQPPRYLLPPVEARISATKLFIAAAGTLDPVAKVEDFAIPGLGGEIPIRVITPAGNGPFPVLVYSHGGGWTFGNIDTHEAACRKLANEAGCVVVSVEYRLAPENKFPAAAEDAYSATKWVADNAARINVDPTRIAVGGDSAGGNAAAVTCLMARDRGGPAIAFQLLIYPVLDYYEPGTPSYQEHATGYFLTQEAMKKYWENYLADPAEAKNPYASPLQAENLAGLPPALLVLAEYDPLVDEGKLYAVRLEQAGVYAKINFYEGVMHGFFNMPGMIELARQAISEAAQELKSALHK